MSRLKTVYREILIAIIPVIILGLLARVATGTFSWREIFSNRSNLEAVLVGKSPDIVSARGERYNLEVELENRSDVAWTRSGNSSVLLLADKVVKDPFFAKDSTWISGNKIGLFEEKVEPGSRGHFRFTISTDMGQGDYKVKFSFVDADLKEIKGVKPLIWLVKIEDSKYGFQLVSQSENPAIEKGKTAILSARYKNTGNSVWKNFGEHPVTLDIKDRDKKSVFYDDPRWSDENTATYLDEDFVPPGEEGTFTFEVKAPDSLGVVRETFVPNIEGIDVGKVPDLSFDIAVSDTSASKLERAPQENKIKDGESMKFYAAAVDHGDAYVLITPSEEVVVFDTGHPSRANVVINLLKKIGVDKIDYMFLSHSHWDHIGGAPYIMDVYPVDKIYINGEGYPYGTYEKMAKYFGEDADNVHLVSLGDEIDLSGGVRVRILNPKEKLSGTNDNDEEVNNNALVAKISWEDAVVLLPSDIYSDTMKNIMENEDIVAKVLSLPHHGMNGMTGAEREFFAEVHPMVAIKASNYDELKNSTSQELLHELGVLGSTLFATAEYGTLLVEFDGKGSMEVSSGNIVWRE